jgi:hypothetical protein
VHRILWFRWLSGFNLYWVPCAVLRELNPAVSLGFASSSRPEFPQKPTYLGVDFVVNFSPRLIRRHLFVRARQLDTLIMLPSSRLYSLKIA